ncbi:Outer membrane protein assembly factor BamA [Emticicia aquatica]|uniref:Outer membrane protein assembly factor BamA n=1 Tax=Emticicia aquatica TaxID=1681835 RepID=A0ABM9ATI2_9BACT|nr:BamA/TamA family outer membrane protein [Emticicia aquatica]CAH0997306.1 Outer membrane protein assembly factor BamA [Emticicia aquatica]
MIQRLIFFVFLFLQIAYFECFADEVVMIRQVKVVGNIRTKEKIIFREMFVKVNDTLQKEQLAKLLEADRKKIFNTNLFITVKVTSQELDNQQVDVLVEVKERLFFVFLPVFYLADRNINEWWYERNHDLRRTIYGVFGKHANLTGNNDQLKIRAEVGFIPNFEIAYSTPYLDKSLKTTLLMGAFYGINKTMVYRTWQDKFQFVESEKRQRERLNLYLVLSRRTGFFQNQSLEISYNQTQIGDTVALLNPNYFLNGRTQQKYFLLNYSYIYDRRDNRQYALKGYRVGFQATKYGLTARNDINQLNLSASFSQYLPLSGNFYGNYSLRGKVSFPQKQPFLQTQGLGYRNDLVRGYELYVIDGQSYGLIKTNLKYRALDHIFDLSKFLKIKQFNVLPVAAYVNTFLDVGYVKNNFPALNNTKLANKWLVGGGIGLDVVTWYNVVGRLNYSLNGSGEKRLFFNLSREF